MYKQKQWTFTCENPDPEWTSGTYWDETGTYESLGKELDLLIPDGGSVINSEENPKLENYRKMVNAYYDLFNNGGGNSERKTAHYFPRTTTYARRNRWSRCYEITEPKMDKAILLAAKEQGIVQ